MENQTEVAIGHLRAGRFAEGAAALEAALAQDWRSPELSHLAGSVWLWQALDAAERNDLTGAADCWDLAMPHLVVAFYAESYRDRFATKRGQTYGQALTSAQVTAGVEAAIAFVEKRIKELAARTAEAEDERLAQRLDSLYTHWRLEREAAARVRRLGGVPDGRTPARCMVMGPKFAARYGVTDSVRLYLERFETRTEMDEIIAMVTGSENPLATARREALYCFSDLAMPFVYHLTDRNAVALDLLRSVTVTASADGPGSQAPTGSAVATRSEARDLAIRILIGLGADELKRVQCDPDIVFERFNAALREAQPSDSAPDLAPPARKVRRSIGAEIETRIEQLVESEYWGRAVHLAKVLAKLDPTRERINQIVELLKRQAAWHFNRDAGAAQAIDSLQRALMLAPDDQQARHFLLICYAAQLRGLMEGKCHLEAAQCCMEILDEVRWTEEAPGDRASLDSELKQLAENVKAKAAAVLLGSMQEVEGKADEQWMAQAHAYVIEAVKGGVANMPVAGASRLAHQALKLAEDEQWAAAYTSVDKAYSTLPEEPQVRTLYESLTAAAVGKLCESGEIDRADEIAERACSRMPESTTLRRARARISLHRVDSSRLTSMDPEEIANAIATLESRIDGSKQMGGLEARAGRYAAIIDPRLRMENQLANVQRLVSIGRCAAALALLDEEKYTGMDNAFAEYLRCKALRFIGKPHQAMEVVDRILTEFPLLLLLHQERARVLSQSGRFDEAEDLFMKCRESEDVDAAASEITSDLGLNAWRAGRDEDAASQMRLIREVRTASLEGTWIECMALKRLGRTAEVTPIIETALQGGGLTPWQESMLRWLAGEVSDETLAAAAQTREEKLELHYWLGEKQRASGDPDQGRELIRSCLNDTALGAHHEFQHAQALLLSGQI